MKAYNINRIFLLLVIICIIHTRTNAQNTGPVAPEAMQFEPVDATDMVNLLTGDFAYVLPLLEVPGPSGGYPIALSYHGGVTMDQETSWVGLGWNINPGAINRNVNGIPDDFNGESSIGIFYNEGGTFTKNFVNVYIPLESVQIGIGVTWGSARSVYGSVGINGVYGAIGVGSEGSFVSGGIGVSIGGQFTGNVGISAGTSGMNLSGGINHSLSSGYGISGGLNASVGTSGSAAGIGINQGYSGSSMDVSLSSSGTSVGGAIGQKSVGRYNDNTSVSSNSIHTKTEGWQAILFGHYETDWWFYNQNESRTFGALNMQYVEKVTRSLWRQDAAIQAEHYKTDVYNIYSSEYEFLFPEYENTENNMMFPAYDYYNINAQGLSGSIQPRIFDKGLLFGETKTLDEYAVNNTNNFYDQISKEVLYSNTAGYAYNDDIDRKLATLADDVNPYFYFEGMATGWIQVLEGEIERDGTDKDPVWGGYKFSKITVGDFYKDYSTNSDETKNRRADGNMVEYFTNVEIEDFYSDAKSRGFIEANCLEEVDRKNEHYFDPDGIGAFVVTKADGMKYHYSLPVYQFEEIYYNQEAGSDDFYLNVQMGKYAYTWLLTAITGPDYYDNGNEGFDEDDYGYWVELKYGKWSDGYIWKMPYTDTEDYKFGRKQIYYLNSIETKTHRAYFIKDIRTDGLGTEIDINKNLSFVANSYPNIVYPDCSSDPLEPIQGGYTEVDFSSNIAIDNNSEKHKLLKLKKILLLERSDENLISPVNSTNYIDEIQSNFHLDGTYDYSTDCDWHIKSLDETFKSYYQDNVIDVNDLQDAGIENKALRIIEFNYNDSDPLCQQTPNSEAINQGKLTLSSVQMLGNGGVRTMPAYKFKYNRLNDNQYDEDNADLWGFDREYPENWSLNKIITPLGGTINVEYESDSYNTMAAFGELFHVMHVDEIESANNGDEIKIKIPEGYTAEDFINDVEEIQVSGEYEMTVAVWSVQPRQFLYNATKTLNAIAKADYLNHDDNFIYLNNFEDFQLFYYSNQYDYIAITMHSIQDIKNLDIKIKYNKDEQLGGGLRVSNIALEDEIGNTYSTDYSYLIPSTSITSGVTTYEPFSGKTFIPYVTEIPGPGVYYEYVTKKDVDMDGNSLGEIVYHFEIPAVSSNPTSTAFSMGEQFEVDDNSSTLEDTYTDGNAEKKVDERHSIIRNRTSQIGRLKSMNSYNNHGELLSSTENVYCEDSELPGGYNEETFYHLKNVRKWTGSDHTESENQFYFNVSSRMEFPSVLKETVTRSGSQTTTTTYEDFDPYTGASRAVRTVQTDGKEYKSVSIPAYTLDVYSGDATTQGMGSKMINPNNANMLTQEAASYTYLNTSTTGEDWQPIGAAVQTWKGDWNNYWYYDAGSNIFIEGNPYPTDQKVWRKHQNFIWKGDVEEDGTYNWTKTGDEFDETFDFSLADNDAGWTKTSEITRYNLYSTVVEAKDMYDRFSSSLHDENNRMICTASNASFSEFAYSGAEEEEFTGGVFAGGMVTKGGGNVISSDENVHSGNNALEVTSGNNGFIFSTTRTSDWHNALEFIMYVWVKGSVTEDMLRCNAEMSGEQQAFSIKDWTLLTKRIKIASATGGSVMFYCYNNSNSTVYFDDFKVQPVSANTIAYNYDEQGNVTAILDNNNFATKYEYYKDGKLKSTYKETPEGFKKVSDHAYNYERGFYLADFTFEPTAPEYGDVVTFTASDLGTGATYSWNFGDGSSSYGRVASHSYDKPSDENLTAYTVTLSAVDENKRVYSINKQIKAYYPVILIENPIDESSISLLEGGIEIAWQTTFNGEVTIDIQNGLTGESFIQDIDAVEESNDYFWDLKTNSGTTFPAGECIMRIYKKDDTSVYDQISFTFTN